MEQIGEDAAVLIDVDAQGSVEGIGSVVGLAYGMRGLLGGDGRKAEKKEKKRLPALHGVRIAPESSAAEP